MLLGFFCFISQCRSCQTIQSYQWVRSTPITAVPQVLNKTPVFWSNSISICSHFTAATFGVVFSTRNIFIGSITLLPLKFGIDLIFAKKIVGVSLFTNHNPSANNLYSITWISCNSSCISIFQSGNNNFFIKSSTTTPESYYNFHIKDWIDCCSNCIARL